MNVYCMSCDSTQMEQLEDYYICMKCNKMVRLDWDGLCKE